MLRNLIRLRIRPIISYRSTQAARYFSDDLPESIKSHLENEKITKPTLIQEKTLPIALRNKDLVGIARTGSGKTLAFILPAITKILENRGASVTAPSCLVLAPTRELATQTNNVLRKFRGLGIRSIVLVGGASRSAQMSDLSCAGHQIYVATPGPLLDLMQNNIVDLSKVKYLVLDEVDRMLDMGFEPQIRSIIKKLPTDRQTLMWSATWPEKIQELANEFMTNYEYIAVDIQKDPAKSDQDKGKPVKFTTSEAFINYKATRNFYGDDERDLPESHNVVLASSMIFGIFYLFFLRDNELDNDGGVNLFKPVHETVPELAIPLLESAIAENRKFGYDTKKLETKLAEYRKDPEKYGGGHAKLIEN